jgi:hypothetical protein
MPATWDAFLLRYRNTPAVRDALTEVPLVVRADGRLAALIGARGAAAADLAGHVRRLEAPGLGEIACLVDGAVTVGPDVAPRHVLSGSCRRARYGRRKPRHDRVRARVAGGRRRRSPGSSGTSPTAGRRSGRSSSTTSSPAAPAAGCASGPR